MNPADWEPLAMTTEVLKFTTVGAVHIVEVNLPDDMDSAEFDRINEALSASFQDRTGGRWIIDLSTVSYMPSAGLGMLVNIRHQVKTVKGHLALCGMSSGLLGIFRACSLERLFTIHKSRQDALHALR